MKIHYLLQNYGFIFGDPTGTGKGGDSIWGCALFFSLIHSLLVTRQISGESRRFFRDEIIPQLHHNQKGVVSMFPLGKDLNCSQIFVSLDEIPSLDGQRTIFGQVAEGLDVLDKINELLVDKNGKLLQNCRSLSYPFIRFLTLDPESTIPSSFMIHSMTSPEWKHLFHPLLQESIQVKSLFHLPLLPFLGLIISLSLFL